VKIYWKKVKEVVVVYFVVVCRHLHGRAQVNDEKISQESWPSGREFDLNSFEFEMGVSVIFLLNYTGCTLAKKDRWKESGRKKLGLFDCTLHITLREGLTKITKHVRLYKIHEPRIVTATSPNTISAIPPLDLSSVQHKSSSAISVTPTLMSLSYGQLGLPSFLFPSGFRAERYFSFLYVCNMPLPILSSVIGSPPFMIKFLAT
jgi:hypothetical protein